MKSLVECVNEARVAKMNRNKFIQTIAEYGKENGYTEVDKDTWLYKSYPKENTMYVKDGVAVSFYWNEGKALSISNASQNGRLKNTFHVSVSSYSDNGYSISNHRINFSNKPDETFDINKMTKEEIDDILTKIKSLINKKIIDKIFKNYYKKRKDNTGYAYKYDDFDHSQIKYDDIK